MHSASTEYANYYTVRKSDTHNEQDLQPRACACH